MRGRVRDALKRDNAKKSDHTMTMVGCTIAELYKYLEDQFVDGMSWENRSEWHIDHRRPCASFNLLDVEQQRMCFHYTNLQPLWSNDNLCKSDKYNEATFTHAWNGTKWIKK